MAHNFCASCGAPIKPGAHFCAACGAPVGDDSNAAAPQAPEALQSFPAPEAPQAFETRAIPPVSEAPRVPDASATVAMGAVPAPAADASETRAIPSVASPAPSAQETVAMPQAAYRPPASGFAAPGETARMQPVAGQATGPQPRVYSSEARPAAPMDAQKKGLIAGIVAAIVVIVVLVAVFVMPALANRGQSAGTAATSSVTSSQEASDSSSSSATESPSSSDAASSSSSSAAAATSSSSSSAQADETQLYQSLLSIYNKLGDYDAQISQCATNFNNYYLSSDFQKRSTLGQQAFSLQSNVDELASELSSLNVPTTSKYAGTYTTLVQLQNDLSNRIAVISEAWDIDLQYAGDPTAHEAEITEPLGRDKVNGSNKYKQDFDAVYPSAKPRP